MGKQQEGGHASPATHRKGVAEGGRATGRRASCNCHRAAICHPGWAMCCGRDGRLAARGGGAKKELPARNGQLGSGAASGSGPTWRPASWAAAPQIVASIGGPSLRAEGEEKRAGRNTLGPQLSWHAMSVSGCLCVSGRPEGDLDFSLWLSSRAGVKTGRPRLSWARLPLGRARAKWRPSGRSSRPTKRLCWNSALKSALSSATLSAGRLGAHSRAQTGLFFARGGGTGTRD